MAKYKKKPVIVEAILFPSNNEVGGTTIDYVVNWINQGKEKPNAWHNGTDIFIQTLEGEMKATSGDFIIKGVNGEYYPCKPDIFEKTYDKVED